MKGASSGPRRTTSSASWRIRVHTGSILSSAPARACLWAMTVSCIPPHACGRVLAQLTRPITGGGKVSCFNSLSRRGWRALVVEEFEHAGFEHLVADREHVVAIRNIERL